MSIDMMGVDLISDFLSDTQHLSDIPTLTEALFTVLNKVPTITTYSLINHEEATDAATTATQPEDEHHQRWQINETLTLDVAYSQPENATTTAPLITALVQCFRTQLIQADMAESVSVLDHVLTATEDGIWDWNAVTQQATYSSRWKSMLGYAADELQDHFSTWEELLHPEDKAAALASAQAFFANPRHELHSTFRLRCKDGTYKWILSRGKVVEWIDQHTPKRIIGTHVDVDNEKRLEQELAEAHRKLKHEQDLLLKCGQMASIGTWQVNITQQTIFWSEKTKEIHEVPPDFKPDLSGAIRFYKEDWSRSLITEKFSDCVEHGTPYDIELIIVTAQGKEKWVRAIGTADLQSSETVIYGLFQDIDERVRTVEKLEKEQRKAQEANIAKSDFLASMSHEIRTPINGVIGMISQMKHTNLTQRQEYQADLALSSAQSLLSVINDILDISKIESNKLTFETFEFNAEQLFSGIAKSVSFSVQERPVTVFFSMFDPRTYWLFGDKGKLGQIFTNILGNAIKFTESGTIKAEIWCESTDTNNTIRLYMRVTDSGPGISLQDQQKIFDRFGQADSSATRKHGGTGLGLAIARQLCLLMGGDIFLASAPGQGSTFTAFVSLPSTAKAHTASDQLLFEKRILLLGIADEHATHIQHYLENAGAMVHVETKVDPQALSADHYDLLLTECTLDHGQANRAGDLTENIATQIAKTVERLGIKWATIARPASTATSTLTTLPSQSQPPAQTQMLEASLVCTQPFTPSDVDKIASLLKVDNAHVAELNQRHHEDLCQAMLGDSHLAGKSILVAEDNSINQVVIEGILDELGVKSVLASNGEEAIALLNEAAATGQAIDLVLMDCQMPVLDGYSATQRIRRGEATEAFRNIPVIALTANAMTGDREKCLAVGMNDYLSKPIETDNLLYVLKQYLAND